MADCSFYRAHFSFILYRGHCGSCWAFSAIGALEGAFFLATKKLVSFSEEDLVECASSSGSNGCRGGIMDDAFRWMAQHGICTSKEYPYSSGDGVTGACAGAAHNATCAAAAAMANFTDVPAGEGPLLAAVARAPVSIAVQANQPDFQLYSGGIITANCGNKLDHGVVVVGYGTDAHGVDYWRIKNSWGTQWGEAGDFRVVRGKGMCGVGLVASYPTGVSCLALGPLNCTAPAPAAAGVVPAAVAA